MFTLIPKRINQIPAFQEEPFQAGSGRITGWSQKEGAQHSGMSRDNLSEGSRSSNRKGWTDQTHRSVVRIKYDTKIRQRCGHSCVIVAGRGLIVSPTAAIIKHNYCETRFKYWIIFTATVTVLFADPNHNRERTQTTKANSVEPPAEHHHITASLFSAVFRWGKKKKNTLKKKNAPTFHKHTVWKLEAGRRLVQIQSAPQRRVQPEACDKITDTPLELFGT